MNFLKSSLVLATLILAPAAWSKTIYYDFDTPNGKLGTSQQYFSDGVLITAYGYDLGHSANLYGSPLGLGLAGTSDHEIPDNGFVQLNLSSLWAQDPTSVQISVASDDRSAGFEIFGSNTLGTLGKELQYGDTPTTITLASTAEYYKYISVTAQSICSDVLINSVSADVSVNCVPEPASFAMMGFGLIGMASFFRKLRK